jgi:Gpi18-like mannosyltransferase
MRVRARTILLIGVVVREAFSFWTAHPFDFEICVRTGFGVANGLSPYSSLPYVPGLSFANDFGEGANPAIGYLPFWPLLLGAIYELSSIGGPGNRFLYYFMIKQPIILADVLLAFLLFLYVKQRSPHRARRVLALWLFSPLTIILSGIWGIFDSMAMVFVLLALLAPEGRARSAWEGIATFVKSIPVIFILPLSYSREKRVVNFAIALGIPVFFTTVVVLATGWPVGGSCFLTRCHTQTVLTTLIDTLAKRGFPLSLWGTIVYLNSLQVVSDSALMRIFSWGGYLWIPAVVIANLLARRWFGFGTDRSIIQSLLVVTLTLLLVRGQVNEQYSIYLLALLLIDAALWSPKRMKLFYAMSVVIIAATVTNNFLLIRFLSPVYPDALQLEAHFIGEGTLLGPLRTALLWAEGLAFSGLNIWYLVALIKERRTGYDLPA